MANPPTLQARSLLQTSLILQVVEQRCSYFQ